VAVPPASQPPPPAAHLDGNARRGLVDPVLAFEEEGERSVRSD
jgi:hypothetical protein